MRFETLFNHSLSLYTQLEKEAKIESIRGVEVNLFRGRLSILYRALGHSFSYYGAIRRALEASGCITILQRGTSTTPSLIVLHHPPERELLAEISEEDLTQPLGDAMLRQQLNDIKARIGGIDIVKALTEQQDQIEDLVKRVRQLEGDKNGKSTKSKSRN